MDVNKAILSLVPPRVSVLDLGCGAGDLLALLRSERQAKCYGVDINFSHVAECLAKGISVYQADLEAGLKEFSDQSYQYIVLSQTLQEVRNPIYLIEEMLRVGEKIIITFPNFAYWTCRFQLLLGRAPVTRALPYDWYDTPNIRVVTFKQLQELCRKQKWHINKMTALYNSSLPRVFLGNTFANLWSKMGIVVLSRM